MASVFITQDENDHQKGILEEALDQNEDIVR